MSAPKRLGKLPDEIFVSWHIMDVESIRPDLTPQQCREVLEEAERDHDATIGINWDVLEFHAEHLFGDPEDDGDDKAKGD